MKILVTGGAGYIGSHTCVELLKHGHDVFIVDNLSNSSFDVINNIEQISEKKVSFHCVDVTDYSEFSKVFEAHQIDGVIHFAGYKAVGESVEKPEKYYHNNIVGTINLASCCLNYGVNKIVFSSSATVYGENSVPFVEIMELLPTTNPYGETKAMCERILKDIAAANNQLSVTILRYFNPIGAHESGLIGERPSGTPNNLMPYITQVAKGKLNRLRIFGNDYDTYDGTGVRDYIHVVDLAEGHVAAIAQNLQGAQIYNLGSGNGTSVLQLIKAFERVTGEVIPYEFEKRRSGDIAICFADVTKAKDELGWQTKKNIEDMCKDAWKFELRNNVIE